MNNHARIYKPRYLAPDRQTFLPIKEGACATGCLVLMTREITAGTKKERNEKIFLQGKDVQLEENYMVAGDHKTVLMCKAFNSEVAICLTNTC
jgi:hypothetical protein